MRGNETYDFALSIDFAKKLSMLARTETGEKIRKYFIDVEKKLKESEKPLKTIDILELTIKNMREQQAELDEIKSDVTELKAKSITRPEYYTIAGWASVQNIKVGLKLAALLGQRASMICKQKGYNIDETFDPRFGKVNVYPKEVLQHVFNQPIVMELF